jgi:hypothetical protein
LSPCAKHYVPANRSYFNTKSTKTQEGIAKKLDALHGRKTKLTLRFAQREQPGFAVAAHAVSETAIIFPLSKGRAF